MRGSKRATGQSEPSATIAPDSRSERVGKARSQRPLPIRVVQLQVRAGSSHIMCCVCIEATTFSAAKRGRSDSCSVSMCSMR